MGDENIDPRDPEDLNGALIVVTRTSKSRAKQTMGIMIIARNYIVLTVCQYCSTFLIISYLILTTTL